MIFSVPTRYRGIRNIPADIFGVILIAVIANLSIILPVVNETPIRIVAGMLFVLFVPGYALVAALFPEAGDSPTEERTGKGTLAESDPDSQTSRLGSTTDHRRIDIFERLALSVALSVSVVSVLALVVTLSSVSFGAMSIFLAINIFVIFCTAVASLRRMTLPVDRRFSVPIETWIAENRTFSFDSRGEMLLNIVLGASIIFAVGTLGFAVLSPPDGETFSEFYVLSEDADGELVAAEYPDSFTPGEPEQLHIGIENQEQEHAEYEVVVQLQRIEGLPTDENVTQRVEIDRFATALAHNETQIIERDLTVTDTLTGEDLRLEFLLYRDSPPEEPTGDTAYRNIHIWVDIQNSGTQ